MYCGQTVGWIKVKTWYAGMQVGLVPGHIVLDGDPAPLPKGAQSPQLLAHICCGQMVGWIKVPLGTEVGPGLGDCVLDGDTARPPQKGAQPAIFGPFCTVQISWHFKSTRPIRI